MLEKRIEHFNELCNHKKILIDSCRILSIYFLNNGDEESALKLMKRAFIHDISKLSNFEFHAADAFDSFVKNSNNREYVFSVDEKVFLNEHWRNNKHHPEHWDDVYNMTDIDIAEMVCDWHARSVEFNDDLKKYIEHRQNTRFSFPEDIYNKILHYADILVNETLSANQPN